MKEIQKQTFPTPENVAAALLNKRCDKWRVLSSLRRRRRGRTSRAMQGAASAPAPPAAEPPSSQREYIYITDYQLLCTRFVYTKHTCISSL